MALVWNKSSLIIIAIFAISIICISSNAQPAKAGIPNGNIITSVTGTYAVGGNICFDGAFYYVFYESATNLYYAYATNPLGTWNTKTISSGGGSYMWSVSCGQNTIPTIIAYAVSSCTCNITIFISSIQGGNIVATTQPSHIYSGVTNTMISFSILDNFYAYGGVPGQAPYPVDALLWILFEYETTNIGNCGVTELKIGGTYPPSRLIGNVSMATSTLDYAGNCNTLPGYIYDNKGLPAVVYDCAPICTYGADNSISETQINKIINQTTYYWDTPISTPITKDYTGQAIYYDYTFASNIYNGNILAIGECYISSIYSYPCNGFNIIDYWSFNLLDQNWTEISSHIAGTLSARSLLLNTDSNTGITRVYYYNSSSIQYFYPVNETGSTIHVGYLSAGNTINGITINQYSQAQNYYYAYTVSSTSPALLEWASYTTQPQPLTQTKTSVIFTTVIITPTLSKCTNTNSCTTNQFSQFMVILLPSIIFLAIGEYFTFKLGVKDERVYILVFMFVISAVGFLSALGGFGNNGIPWYIPIFSDIVGFMLILTFKGNSGGL